jgi:hypothetical protein
MKFDYNEIVKSWTSKDLLVKMTEEERMSLPSWVIKKMQLREIEDAINLCKKQYTNFKIYLFGSMIISMIIDVIIGFYAIIIPVPFLIIVILKYISNKEAFKIYNKIKETIELMPE